jgi:hypothetical protein
VIHQLVPDDNMDAATGSYWYPDTSRAVRSSSSHPGWEYRHYLPEDMLRFLATHFPGDVVWTFKSLAAHALRLDLFRYCILLIHGGIFVNDNVLLESRLDAVLDPEVGFMASTDSRVRTNTRSATHGVADRIHVTTFRGVDLQLPHLFAHLRNERLKVVSGRASLPPRLVTSSSPKQSKIL